MPEISSQNIINHVSIEPTIGCAWIDALADISKNIRYQKGTYNKILKLEHEKARLRGDGVLTLSTSIDGTQVEMDIPPGMWCWAKQSSVVASRES